MIKLKKLKKPAVCLFALMLTVGAGISTVSASRDNTSWYTTNLGAIERQIDYTGARVKETNTRAYTKITRYDGENKITYLSLSNGEKQSIGTPGGTESLAIYKYHENKDIHISNGAYRLGVRNVRLKFSTDWHPNGAFYIGGVWSPDSGQANPAGYR